MKFDKALYWKRRNNVNKETKEAKPLRGQGSMTVTIIAKGDPVFTVTKDGKKVDINKLGEHRSFDSKGKMIISNRADSRRKRKLHFHTKKRKGFAQFSTQDFYTKDEAKDLKLPTWRVNLPKNWRQPVPSQPIDLTNHDRHKLRQTQRGLKKLQKAEE